MIHAKKRVKKEKETELEIMKHLYCEQSTYFDNQ